MLEHSKCRSIKHLENSIKQAALKNLGCDLPATDEIYPEKRSVQS